MASVSRPAPRAGVHADLRSIAIKVVLGLAAVAIGVVALFDLERTVSSADADLYRMAAARLEITGGNYYVDGIDHKGPLWMFVYHMAFKVSPSLSTYWFVIATMALAVAAATGWGVRKVLGHFDVTPIVARLVGAGTGAYLVLGREEFSWVLYGRNLVMLLTVGALVGVVGLHRPEAKPALRAALAGAAMGLATQSVPTAAAAGLVLTAWVFVIARRLPVRRFAGLPTPFLSWVAGGLAAFVSAPVWFLVKGQGSDYWFWWWTYNRTYRDATGTSTADLVSNGFRGVGEYYIAHPVYAVIVIAFVARFALGRSTLTERGRIVHGITASWWAAELVGLVAAERFFPHYWIVAFLPTMLMLGLLIHAATEQLSLSSLRRVPALAMAAVMVIAIIPRLASGVAVAADFEGTEQHYDHYLADTYGHDSLVHRAVVHVLTEPTDPVYVWGKEGWMVNLIERPPATRFNPRRWLLGQIPGTDTRSDRVVYDWMWEALVEDFEMTPPEVIVQYLDEPVPAGSTLATYLEDFSLVYEDDGTSAETPFALPAVRIWSRSGVLPVTSSCTVVEGSPSVGMVGFRVSANRVETGRALPDDAFDVFTSSTLAYGDDATRRIRRDGAEAIVSGNRILGAVDHLGAPPACS